MKDERIKLLIESLVNLRKIKTFYTAAFPAWILINSSQGFIKSLLHLESETTFDEETLGVIGKESEFHDNDPHREVEIKDGKVTAIK